MADPHAHPGIPDTPVRFDEAVQALRDKVPVTRAVWDDLTESEREFAFTLANVAQADLITDALEYMETAVRDGSTFEEFQGSDVADRLTEAWGGEAPYRLESLFRTTTMTAYNEGRFRQQTTPAAMRARPYLRYDAIEDSTLAECPICSKCSGVILPADHPWWRTHYPILHPRCRCIATSLSEEDARDEGITGSPPNVSPAPGFGKAPSMQSYGWEPDAADYPSAVEDVLSDRLDDAS